MTALLYPPHKPLVRLCRVISPLKGGGDKLRTNSRRVGGWRWGGPAQPRTPLRWGRGDGVVEVAVRRRPCSSSTCFHALAALDGAGAGEVAAPPSSVAALAVEEVEVAAVALPLPVPDGGRCRVPVPMVAAVAVEVEDFHLEAPAPRRPALADGPRADAVEVAALAAVARPRSGRRRMVEAAEPPRSPQGARSPSPPSRSACRRCPPQGGRWGRWRGGCRGGRRRGGAGQGGWIGNESSQRYYFLGRAGSFQRPTPASPRGGIEKFSCNWSFVQLEGGPMERSGLWLAA